MRESKCPMADIFDVVDGLSCPLAAVPNDITTQTKCLQPAVDAMKGHKDAFGQRKYST